MKGSSPRARGCGIVKRSEPQSWRLVVLCVASFALRSARSGSRVCVSPYALAFAIQRLCEGAVSEHSTMPSFRPRLSLALLLLLARAHLALSLWASAVRVSHPGSFSNPNVGTCCGTGYLNLMEIALISIDGSNCALTGVGSA